MKGGEVVLCMVVVCASVLGACTESSDQCVIERRGLDRRVVRVSGDCRGRSFEGVDLSSADISGVMWGDNVCPDGSRSQDNADGTCQGHLRPVEEGPEDLREEVVEPPGDVVEGDEGADVPVDVPVDVPIDVPDDSGGDSGDVEGDADCERNACGGCGPLERPLGASCDACVESRLVCGEDGEGACQPQAEGCLEVCDPGLTSSCPGRTCSNGRCVPRGLVWVPPGEVMVGLGGSDVFGEEVVRPTTISVGLLVMPHEVTQLDWVSWVGNEPWGARECSLQCPVERVTWFEALVYANTRSLADGLRPCYRRLDGVTEYEVAAALNQEPATWPEGVNCEGWRLPTEAEWEHIARARSVSAWACGADERCLSGVARYGLELEEGPQEVGSLQANGWGLYDTLGNVSEWCWDWYGELDETRRTDPVGPPIGNLRIFRGGAFYSPTDELRSGYRNAAAPGFRDSGRGVRLVRSVRAP